MPWFKLTIAYDGTLFSGWQAQPGRRTVQGILQEAWRSITGEEVQVTASSRTDAGVHALGQTVGIETGTHLSADQLCRALNAKLPADVTVRAVAEAPADFHATHHAVGKRYQYRVYNHRLRPLFERQCVWHVPQELDADAMHRAGQVLVGKHDFASFQAAGSERDSTVRTIHAVEVRRGGGERASEVVIEVAGDGFLYNMVRIIVGSLVEVGQGRREESWLGEVLAGCDRRLAGRTAPPQGLCLLQVDYDLDP